MKNINKFGNISSIIILLIFFALVIFQNINYNPKVDINKFEKFIDICTENKFSPLETLKCIGENY